MRGSWNTAARWGHRLLLTVLYLFLLAPIFVVVILAFNDANSLSLPLQGVTFDWFVQLVNDRDFVDAFFVSMIVGVVVTIAAAICGVLIALVVDRYQFPGKSALSGLFLAPLLVPTVVLGLALLLVLSPFQLTGTIIGLVIAHFGITIPYIVRTTLMSLQTSDVRCEEAARVLGANPFTVFRRVTLPIAFPGILAGAVMGFIISFDEAVISLFVASSGSVPLPVEMFRYVEFRADPMVAALSTLLILFALIAVIVVERVIGLRQALR